MSKINETLIFTIDKKKVKAIHKGTKAFKDQAKGLDELKAFVRDEIVFQNKSRGFIPYNNFESSVDWKVMERGLNKMDNMEKSVKNFESELKLLNKNIECITLILFKDLTKNMTEEAKNKIEAALVKLKK